ncbi:MAG: protease modulator HflK [Planctomycetota bacterium]|nr:MAG: protease modulator HflK [Planctomycetota bacterium]REJ88401.1 MAG: protease modulator HflK [Planctomycetota bacterium]REK30637.1 MAG: protease modulator HflK [Planctomycetota bacterium]REK33011.1 MAG: protease modulator HflK [Planctomycetota bacterium]
MSHSSHTVDREGDSHRGALRTGLALLLVTAAAALVIAFQSESPLLRAAGLELLFCATAIWGALDAVRLRRKAGGDSPPDAAEHREDRSLHHLFLAAPTAAILVLTTLAIVAQLAEVPTPPSSEQLVVIAIAAALAACLWTVFVRVFASIDADDLPESVGVSRAFAEARAAAVIVGLAQLLGTVAPVLTAAAAWLILIWILVAAAEQLLRSLAGWFTDETAVEQAPARFVSPVSLVLREVCLSSTNPVGALFDLTERRFGLSFRSSWTLKFLRRSVLPVGLGSVLVVWLSTVCVVIEPHQLGVREAFGRCDRELLEPGLHAKLPWPLGVVHRAPVRTIRTMQIGFSDPNDAATVAKDERRSLLWTQPHAEEFALVLGTQTEVVAINAVVYYRVQNNPEAVFDYVYHTANPEAALENYAYRALMEETQTASLTDLLSRDREQFAARVEERLNDYSRQSRLALDVVDVALINLHPPVEAASHYLDVVNAQVDAERVVVEAQGAADAMVFDASSSSDALVSRSKVEAARRVSEAGRESSEFDAIRRAYEADPETFQLRLWYETLESSLASRRVFVIDANLPNVVFDDRAAGSSIGPEITAPQSED